MKKVLKAMGALILTVIAIYSCNTSTHGEAAQKFINPSLMDSSVKPVDKMFLPEDKRI